MNRPVRRRLQRIIQKDKDANYTPVHQLHLPSVKSTFRVSAEAEKVAAGIRSDGGQAIAAVADVTSPPEVEAMFEKIREELGPVTGLVNNAAS